MMRKYIVIVIFNLFLLPNLLIAQAADPELTSPTVPPSPQALGNIIEVCVTLQNEPPTAVPYSAVNPTQIVITLNKLEPTGMDGTVNFTFDDAQDGTDSWFTWDAECVNDCGTEAATWVLTGTQNQVIPGCFDPLSPCPSQEYCFEVEIIAESTAQQALSNNGHGFNANIVPCAFSADCDAENGPDSNNQSRYGHTETPSPVELMSFTAESRGLDAVLSWVTASEVDNDRFEIERSLDGVRFEKIGEVKGNGTTSARNSYSYTDRSIGSQVKGKVYYRLHQVDYDGKWENSDVRRVTFGSGSVINVYPNPTNGNVTIELPISTSKIKVYDMTGNLVREDEHASGAVYEMNDLQDGLYIIRAENSIGEEIGTERVMKIK